MEANEKEVCEAYCLNNINFQLVVGFVNIKYS